jgi:hypothetical protein
MFALRDREHPFPALTDYYRTREEAVEAMSQRKRHEAGMPIDEWIPGEDYLEIIEVERESRPCRYCGGEVQSSNPDCDFCRGCFYTGASQEDACEPALAMLRTIPGAKDASVWHTGGGCFALGVTFQDGSYIMASEEATVTNEDGSPVDPNAPVWSAGFYTGEDDEEGFELDAGTGWGTFTIPRIVELATELVSDPDRYERLAELCDKSAADCDARGMDRGADYYREQAAALRERGK